MDAKSNVPFLVHVNEDTRTLPSVFRTMSHQTSSEASDGTGTNAHDLRDPSSADLGYRHQKPQKYHATLSGNDLKTTIGPLNRINQEAPGIVYVIRDVITLLPKHTFNMSRFHNTDTVSFRARRMRDIWGAVTHCADPWLTCRRHVSSAPILDRNKAVPPLCYIRWTPRP